MVEGNCCYRISHEARTPPAAVESAWWLRKLKREGEGLTSKNLCCSIPIPLEVFPILPVLLMMELDGCSLIYHRNTIFPSLLTFRLSSFEIHHLDAESSPEEQPELHEFVKNHPIFVKFGNVVMITKANLVINHGPTMVVNTLHVAANLLREGGD
ncbi:hypothetical protein L2E82_43312 [Cichorium intybus]|uniref:Uncharacterized protein n=1 Tax=Cichorium intybus TaxID=13427 RepID=A0ACB8ZNH7_CICIN|nr:hypothetical protein L2E82_43312 [Cichorium intybus]